MSERDDLLSAIPPTPPDRGFLPVHRPLFCPALLIALLEPSSCYSDQHTQLQHTLTQKEEGGRWTDITVLGQVSVT